MDPCVQIGEVALQILGIGPSRHAIHASSGLALERMKRLPEQIDAQMVEERGEPLLLPLPCGLPCTGERLGHASPVLTPGACFADPRFPWSPSLAPQRIAPRCSSASQLLRQGQTSLARASTARIEARTGLRMMPTSPRSPYHSVRRVFPSTAGKLAFQTGPSRYVDQLKPAPGMRWSRSSLLPSFVHLGASSKAPLWVGAVGSIVHRH